MSLTDDLIHHMRRVMAADRDLRDLSLQWQMIEASSAISCPEDSETILPTLSETRSRFDTLQQRLISQLAEESLAELTDDLGSTGQCMIDILVRNLFERTADVGFLATDDDLRAFCSAKAVDRPALAPSFQKRLAEYRAKYTVYDDVIVLSPDGAVLARIVSSELASTTDSIVSKAVASRSYVEQFGPTDLSSDEQPALLYAHRVDDPVSGRCIGVLVLRFRFQDEMQRIFASVSSSGEANAMVLMDHNDVVLVSNDEAHVPKGTRLAATADSEVTLVNFAGREYLSVTSVSRGYQGYMGPRWKARVMVSLLTAFRNKHPVDAGEESVSLDNQELRDVQMEVDAINRNLRRVIWNGRLMACAADTDASRLKAVLHQVTLAGSRTRARVAQAIHDLYRTSLGRAQQQASDLARLASDIMDRNLYERANDCRWWALSPVLRQTLAYPVDAAGSDAMGQVLAYINGLYTVYTRLVVFDLEGRIVGLSQDTESGSLLGSSVAPEFLQSVRQLSDTQRYAVSAFEATPLNQGVPSFVYLAAVRHPGSQQVVGGIAIVFNAEREFRSMLDDVLAGRNGVAAFIDADGRVVASTDDRQVIGAKLSFDPSQTVVEYDGAHFAVAQTSAGGYREFKTTDGYDNGIRAVVALRLGSLDRRNHLFTDLSIRPMPRASRKAAADVALFQVGAGRFALAAQSVLEATSVKGIVKTPDGPTQAVGLLEVVRGHVSQVIPVFCARRLFGVIYPARATDGVVLVMSRPDGTGADFGLRVDDVLTVSEVAEEHRQAVPTGLSTGMPMLCSLLRLNSDLGELLVQMIDAPMLRRQLGLGQMYKSGQDALA
jgi:chemotaxis signal transduction protein